MPRYTPRPGAWLGREEEDPAREAPPEEGPLSAATASALRAEIARLERERDEAHRREEILASSRGRPLRGVWVWAALLLGVAVGMLWRSR